MIPRRFLSASLMTGVLVVAVSAFITPVDAKTTRKPKGATAQCEDGSYSHATTQQGACSSHGGIKTWYGDSAASTPAPPSRTATSTSTAPKPPRTSASTPATPTGATAQCKDGSYSSAKTRSGACTGHGGVATWLADSTASTTAAPQTSTEEQKTVPPASTAVESRAPGRSAAVSAPADATAKCKDGTYSHSKTHTGACSHHGGVAEWYQ
jgi:uncharacterized protein DUF3761